jgi:hypothetical protein
MLAKILVIIALLFPAVALANDAGVDAAPDTVTITQLPDAAASPVDAGSFAWKLYKAGHLIPAIILAGFFLLVFLEKRIAWLRTGGRKIYVASALATLGMLAERVGSGTTPNFMMIAGAVGAGLALWIKAHGETAKAPAAGA